MTVTSEVERFIVDHIDHGAGIESVPVRDDLLENGIVDSHGLMEMIGFLEDRYGIRVDDADLVPENFQTLECIERFVERKRG